MGTKISGQGCFGSKVNLQVVEGGLETSSLFYPSREVQWQSKHPHTSDLEQIVQIRDTSMRGKGWTPLHIIYLYFDDLWSRELLVLHFVEDLACIWSYSTN